MSRPTTDIIIVGAGPAGLTYARSLYKFGHQAEDWMWRLLQYNGLLLRQQRFSHGEGFRAVSGIEQRNGLHNSFMIEGETVAVRFST